MPRYNLNKKEWLQNGNFLKGLHGWETVLNAGKISLHSGDAILENFDSSQNISLLQSVLIPHGIKTQRLSVDVLTQDLVEGNAPWETARFLILAIDDQKRKLRHYPHQYKLNPTGGNWYNLSYVYQVPPQAVELVVGVELLATTGTVKIRKMSLMTLEEGKWFRLYANLLLAIWLIAIVWIGSTLLHFFNSQTIGLSFVFFCSFIAICIAIPASTKNLFLGMIWNLISEYLPFLIRSLPEYFSQSEHQAPIYPFPLPKFGHFVLFAILGMFFHPKETPSPLLKSLFPMMLFAASSEVLQYFTLGRSPLLMDWLIDVTGMILGFLFVDWICKKKLTVDKTP